MKQTWLIVEDDPIIRSILTALMTLWGVESLVFKDGHEASQWLDRVERDEAVRLPDIALMDIRVPGPTGPEIGQRMRGLKATSGIPIVIMSAYYLTREEREQVMALARPELMISKPLPAPEDLRSILEKIVRTARQRQVIRPVTLALRQPQYRFLVNQAASKRIALMQSDKLHHGQRSSALDSSTV